MGSPDVASLFHEQDIEALQGRLFQRATALKLKWNTKENDVKEAFVA
jgi:hypothetical protein